MGLKIVQSVLWVVYGSVLAVSAVITFLPEPSPSPLVSLQDWKVHGGFYNEYHPGVLEVSKTIINSPNAAFYRSYTPRLGPTAGEIETNPFVPPRYISIPVFGQGVPKNDSMLYVECLGTEKAFSILRANTNVFFSEAILTIPPGFCDGEVKILAKSKGLSIIGVGTPSQVSYLTFLKSKGIGMIFPHALLFATISLYLFAGATVFGLLSGNGEKLLSLTLLLGATGYVEFFIYNANSYAGKLTTILLLLASLSMLIFVSCTRRELLVSTWRQLRPFLLVWFLGSLAYTAVLYSIDNGGGAWLPNYRFYPAVWSSDNQIPRLIADALGQGEALKGLLDPSGWQVSDRPPLLAWSS